MTTTRAPKGIPTGGRFVANTSSEPTIALGGQAAGGEQSSTSRSSYVPGSNEPVDHDSITSAEMAKLEKLSAESGVPFSRLRVGLRETAEKRMYDYLDRNERKDRPSTMRAFGEKVGGEVVETGEAISALAGHMADVHRGDVPAPEAEGSFVGWGQMVPKFLRRKGSDAAPADPAAAAEAQQEREKQERLKAFGDAVGNLAAAIDRMENPRPQRRRLWD
jgi:hypothetical protein